MKLQPRIIILTAIMMFIVFRMTKFQYQQTEMEIKSHPFDSEMELGETEETTIRIGYLPRGIVQKNSDLELKPLWVRGTSELKDVDQNNRKLLAIAAGIKQKKTVDAIVTKFLTENFTVILFHYDGNVNDWQDCSWSSGAIHITAHNQTKWWFAKRFLHPDIVSIYDYVFLWDEDLGIENFHPGRYLDIVKSEGLDISQPALDPNLSEVHHQITVRKKKGKVHRRVWDQRSGKCSHSSKEPPCVGWSVEAFRKNLLTLTLFCTSSLRHQDSLCGGARPCDSPSLIFGNTFARLSNIVYNDLIHGWGLDMKLGYCAQGDPTKKVGVVDSEFIVHQGVQTLGGPSTKLERRGIPVMDSRTEVRRRARLELQDFNGRWTNAVKEDEGWVDPFETAQKMDSH